MRTDEEVTRAADTTATAILRLIGERNRARAIAAELEAELAVKDARLTRVTALQSKWMRAIGNARDFDYGRWHRAAANQLDASLRGDE